MTPRNSPAPGSPAPGSPARFLDALASLKLTIACLAMLMVLVVACTLAQVELGTMGAVDAYIRTFFVWWDTGTGWSVIVFPGGALVGLVLTANLVAAQLKRLELSWKKSGLWITHAGLILLVLGEFVTGAFQVDADMAIEEGQTVNYTERPHELELALVDTTDPKFDDVYSVPASLLARGGSVAIPGTPLSLLVKSWYANAELVRLPPGSPSPADRGTGATVGARPLRPVTQEQGVNTAVAYVEAIAGGRSHGTWLVSNGLGGAQSFVHEGRTWSLQMRPRREYLPFSLTLRKFTHDKYAGTEIPKNFSSLVHLSDPQRGEGRDVLIYMNQPLRYAGRAFYQSSFGKGGKLSVLQVVENPGWLLPYVSCTLVTIGLLVHFVLSLRRGLRRRQTAEA